MGTVSATVKLKRPDKNAGEGGGGGEVGYPMEGMEE